MDELIETEVTEHECPSMTPLSWGFDTREAGYLKKAQNDEHVSLGSAPGAVCPARVGAGRLS